MDDGFQLKIPKTNYETYGDGPICYTGPKLWNNLPRELRETRDFEIFKKHLKMYLFIRAFDLV